MIHAPIAIPLPHQRTADILAALEACRGLVPPLDHVEAALVDAWPVILDEAQRNRAEALGLAGRLGDLQFDAVVFSASGKRFVFARDRADQRDIEVAFVFRAANYYDVIEDVVAWHPESGRVATLFGHIGTLGIGTLNEGRLTPPMVHENPLNWALADELGLFIINDKLAAAELAGETIAATDLEAGRRLRARLAPHSRQQPDIRFLKARERCSGR